MKVRFVTALALLGAFAGVSRCQKGGAGDIIVGEYSSLTGTTATLPRPNGAMLATAQGNALGNRPTNSTPAPMGRLKGQPVAGA